RDDKVLFIRTTTAIQSNATTMSESPRYVPLNRFSTFSGNVGGTPVFGSGNSFGGAWIPPKGSQAVETQMPPIGMEVEWRTDPVVVISGKRLVIQAVTSTTLTYSLP